MSQVTPSDVFLCPMCLERMSVPVSLPCGHTFCCICLHTMGEGLDQHTCPDCHIEYQPSETSRYQTGTRDLIPNHKTNQNPNVVEYLFPIKSRNDSTAAGEQGLDRKRSAEVQNKAMDIKEFQNKSPLVIVSGADGPQNGKMRESKLKLEPQVANKHQEMASAGDRKKKDGLDVKESAELQHKSPLLTASEEDLQQNSKLDESKFMLASKVTDLSLELEQAEGVLKREQEYEATITTANAKLREKASTFLGELTRFAQSYSEQVMQLIDNELCPGETSVRNRVAKASEMARKIRQAMLQAESLLSEQDANVFTRDVQNLELEIEKCKGGELPEETQEIKFSLAKVCPKLEQLNSEFRDRFGELQRSLRNTVNPSEVTFDPETAHPNLVLSEDLKTVTFSAKKQLYQTSPKRFSSFFQVLSAQSFSEGDHSWEVELEGAPWMIGVCCSNKLPRDGLPSALESSRTSWCLMWNNNLLTAFDRSRGVALKKTGIALRLEIRLNCKKHELSFYNMSASGGRTLVHTFNSILTDPLQLAYRMLSGDPKGRVTVRS